MSRRVGRRPDDRLNVASIVASPRFAQWLLAVFGLAGLFVVLPLAIHGVGAGEAGLRYAAEGFMPFVAYVVLATALIACMLARLRSLYRRTGVDARPRLKMGAEGVTVAVAYEEQQARIVLAKAGYRHISSRPDWAWGVRYRWSPIGTVLLHLGVVFAIAGAILAAVPGLERVEHSRVIVGRSFEAIGGNDSYRLVAIDAQQGEQGTVTRLSASIRNDDVRAFMLRSDFPSLLGAFTTAVVEDYDLSPKFSLLPTSTVVVAASAQRALRLRADGASDRMELAADGPGSYRLTIQRADQEDRLWVSVETRASGRWRLVLPRTEVSRGEVVSIGQARLRFDALSKWALIRTQYAPSAPLVALALLLMVVGSFVRLVTPRSEATIAAMSDSCVVTVHVDAYKGSRSASASLAHAMSEDVG